MHRKKQTNKKNGKGKEIYAKGRIGYLIAFLFLVSFRMLRVRHGFTSPINTITYPSDGFDLFFPFFNSQKFLLFVAKNRHRKPTKPPPATSLFDTTSRLRNQNLFVTNHQDTTPKLFFKPSNEEAEKRFWRKN